MPDALVQPTPIGHTLRLYLRATGLIWQSAPALTAGVAALTVLTAAVTPAQIWISKQMIDRLAALVREGQSASWQALLLPLSLYIAVWAIGQAAGGLSDNARELLSQRAGAYTQQVILRKASRLDIAFFESPQFYDQMSLARTESWRLTTILYQIAVIVTQSLTLISLLALLGRASLLLPLILVVTAAPRMALVVYFSRIKAKLLMGRVAQERMMWYLAWLLSERDVINEIRLFQTQDYLLERHRRASQEYFEQLSKIVFNEERVSLLFTLLSLTGVAVIWGYAGLQAMAGRLGLGDVALIFQAAEGGRGGLTGMGSLGGFFSEHALYLDKLFGFLDTRPDEAKGALSRPCTVSEPAAVRALLAGPIEFRNVTFRYPGAERNALQDVSFTIQPGEKIALVGQNGAGKTTLVKLLARLYDPDSGIILVNGCDLREVEPQVYYRQLGVLFQDFVWYNLTARENIGLGNLTALDDAERIRQAAEMSGADEVIARLPQQYDTILGRVFEGGADLSSGEWQKIALARAFLRDAALWILDEPTTMLDAFAEAQFYNRFAELTGGRTTLFVTHRLSSVRIAEKILVLKDGRLIESGDHDALMAHNGEYAQMFNLQAQRYQQDRERTR